MGNTTGYFWTKSTSFKPHDSAQPAISTDQSHAEPTKVNATADDGADRELEQILTKYGKAVQKWQEKSRETSLHQRHESLKKLEVVPSDARNIILILGQMLLPNGCAHKWMQQRCAAAVQLLHSRKLSISNTYFVVSGSDVSNQKYSYDPKYAESYANAPHACEADVMKDLLCMRHGVPASHVVRDIEARTTLESAYYFLKLLFSSGFYFENQVKSGLYALENVFVVTSDWHIEHIRFNLNALFAMERVVGVAEEASEKFDEEFEDTGVVCKFVRRKYKICEWFTSANNIEYVAVASGADAKLFEQEKKLLEGLGPHAVQAKEYCDYLWKWRDEKLLQRRESQGQDTRTMQLFGKSMAIEHMYWKLSNSREKLVKLMDVHVDAVHAVHAGVAGAEQDLIDSDEEYQKYAIIAIEVIEVKEQEKQQKGVQNVNTASTAVSSNVAIVVSTGGADGADEMQESIPKRKGRGAIYLQVFFFCLFCFVFLFVLFF